MAGEIALGNLNDEAVKNRHINSAAGIDRGKLGERALVAFPINLATLRVWDAFASVLPATGGTDDLGLYTGTFGTSGNRVKTGDVKTLGATTRYARFLVAVPGHYNDGEDLQIRALAGMETTIADVSAVIDFEAYKLASDGTVGSDLVTTSATTINSLTIANKDFVITPTGIVPGDILDVRLTITTNDGSGATAVIAVVAALWLRADVKP